jgi:hypothetical protein
MQACVRAEKVCFGDAFVYGTGFHGERMFISDGKKDDSSTFRAVA